MNQGSKFVRGFSTNHISDINGPRKKATLTSIAMTLDQFMCWAIRLNFTTSMRINLGESRDFLISWLLSNKTWPLLKLTVKMYLGLSQWATDQCTVPMEITKVPVLPRSVFNPGGVNSI